jgi:hypothetical protein
MWKNRNASRVFAGKYEGKKPGWKTLKQRGA